MAFTTTPERFYYWATNSDSEKTDPGATLVSNGWAVGDAPASSHFNYLLHSAAGWASLLPRVCQDSFGWNNIDYDETTSSNPWGGTSDVAFHVEWKNGRWYVIRIVAANTIDLFDSTDGETWTAKTNFHGATVTTDEWSRPVVDDGGILYLAVEGKIYKSTDNTAENLITGGVTPTWGALTQVREMVWDSNSGRFYACGTTGVDGKIEATTDPTGTWAVEDSRGGAPYVAMDVSPNGVFLAATNSASNTRMSDDGLTWVAGPVFPAAVTKIVWSPQLDAFLALDASNNLYAVPEMDTTEIDLVVNPSNIWMLPDFVITRDATTEEIVSHKDNGTATTHHFDSLGYSHIGIPIAARYGVFIGNHEKCIFPWADGTTTRRAVMYYGAQNGTSHG